MAESEPLPDEEERERNEVVREAVTMALYVSLSQLAVLTALPRDQATEDATLAWTIALTSVGLVLAHRDRLPHVVPADLQGECPGADRASDPACPAARAASS